MKTFPIVKRKDVQAIDTGTAYPTLLSPPPADRVAHPARASEPSGVLKTSEGSKSSEG